MILFKGEGAEAEHEVYEVELLVTESLPSGPGEEDEAEEQKATDPKDEESVSAEHPTSRTCSSPADLTCLTVQPARVLCGVRLKPSGRPGDTVHLKRVNNNNNKNVFTNKTASQVKHEAC